MWWVVIYFNVWTVSLRQELTLYIFRLSINKFCGGSIYGTDSILTRNEYSIYIIQPVERTWYLMFIFPPPQLNEFLHEVSILYDYANITILQPFLINATKYITVHTSVNIVIQTIVIICCVISWFNKLSVSIFNLSIQNHHSNNHKIWQIHTLWALNTYCFVFLTCHCN